MKAWLQFGSGAGPFLTAGAPVREDGSAVPWDGRWYAVRDGFASIEGERVRVSLEPATAEVDEPGAKP